MSKRYTIAVDFDGVIHSYTTPWVNAWTIPDPPVEGAIEWLRSMVSHFDVVIFSTRCKSWRGRRAMKRWLWLHDTGGNGSYAMWEDLDPVGMVKFAKSKPPALIYLDDRAWRFAGPGTFPSKDDIHLAWPWHKAKEVAENVSREFQRANREAVESMPDWQREAHRDLYPEDRRPA